MFQNQFTRIIFPMTILIKLGALVPWRYWVFLFNIYRLFICVYLQAKPSSKYYCADILVVFEHPAYKKKKPGLIVPDPTIGKKMSVHIYISMTLSVLRIGKHVHQNMKNSFKFKHWLDDNKRQTLCIDITKLRSGPDL